VLLIVTLSIPNGVDVEELIVTFAVAPLPGRMEREFALNEQELPGGSPVQAKEENVPEYPPSLVIPKNNWRLSPGSIDRIELGLSVFPYRSQRPALTPVTKFGLGWVAYATAVCVPSFAYSANT
jgi:hypothetical protein